MAQCNCDCHKDVWMGVNPPQCNCSCSKLEAGQSGQIGTFKPFPSVASPINPAIERLENIEKRIEKLEKDVISRINNLNLFALNEKINDLQESYQGLAHELKFCMEELATTKKLLIPTKLVDPEETKACGQFPHKCPVCEGTGKNVHKLIPAEEVEKGIHKLVYPDCHACEKGVLWK